MADHSEDHCPKSEDGKHEPDWQSVHVNYDVEVYVDINCKNCGQSGCVGSEKTLAQDICW